MNSLKLRIFWSHYSSFSFSSSTVTSACLPGKSLRFISTDNPTNQHRDYFVAGGALYIFSLFAAWFRTHFINGRHSAAIDLLPCGFVRVTIPTILSWRPGQHIFIRFLSPQLGLHCLAAHPFTICSLSDDPDKIGKASKIVFYLRPHGGITARLAKVAAKSPAFSKTVLLEGPYGGISNAANPTGFDTVLVIAGGSGGGFSLAIAEEALRAYENVSDIQRRKIQVVFATRNGEVAEWYREEIEDRISTYNVPAENISVSIHDTSAQLAEGPVSSPKTEEQSKGITDQVEPALSEKESRAAATGQHASRISVGPRPNLPRIIATSTSEASSQRIAIFACGPASMLHDVRNAAAEAQKRALRGGAEVYLHTESFA
jgi:ferric-chelate reductase